jgi:hypothetical protein
MSAAELLIRRKQGGEVLSQWLWSIDAGEKL